VISFSVTQRTKEIGIRMALGGQRGDVLRLVLRQSGMLALVGILLGLPIAFAATRLLGTTLYGVGAADPATISWSSQFSAWLHFSPVSFRPSAPAGSIQSLPCIMTDRLTT
jgi:ABC-type antimicrobial peptide transport system permease subunit